MPSRGGHAIDERVRLHALLDRVVGRAYHSRLTYVAYTEQGATVVSRQQSIRSGDHADRAAGESCECGKDGVTTECESGCGCCGMSGRGGKLRIGLLVVLAVVVVVLLVYGFATAG